MYGSDMRGNRNYFELAGVSSYRGFELPRVNYSKCMKKIQGKSFWVRVSEGSSYRESTVVHLACSTLMAFCVEKYTSWGFLGQFLNLFLRFPTAVTKILSPFFINRPTITSSRFPDHLPGTACSSLFQALHSRDRA